VFPNRLNICTSAVERIGATPAERHAGSAGLVTRESVVERKASIPAEGSVVEAAPELAHLFCGEGNSSADYKSGRK